MIKLELTVQEADILAQLIDLAVKAAGMKVAEVAVILSHKIVAAANAQNGAAPVAVTTAESAVVN